MTKTATIKHSLTIAVLLAGWALRVHALGAKSLWYDELRQVEVAQRPLAEMSPLLIEHAARPLDYLITHLWLRGVGPVDASGRAEFWLRFPAALASLLSVAAMRPLARKWMRRDSRLWPLLPVVLMAAAPLGVVYGQELRPYALYVLWSLLSFYWLLRALEVGTGRAWGAFAAVAMAGALTHFFFAFVLAAQGLYVAGWAAARLAGGRAKQLPASRMGDEALGANASPLRRGQEARRGLAGFGLGAAAGLAALFVAARPEHLALFARQFAAALVSAPVTGFVSDRGAAVALDEALNADLLLRGLLPFYGGGGGLALIPFVGLAGLGLAGLAWRDRGRLALAVLWLIVAPALVIVYLQFRQEFFAIRYILFALPVYLLLAAGGLGVMGEWVQQRRPGWGKGVMAPGAALLVGLQLAQVALDYGVPKDDWRRVGAFLTANVRPGDTVGAPDVQAFVRFYAPGQPGALVEVNERGPHEQALANGERFWFVWSDLTLTPIDQTRAWVEELPGVSIQLDPRIRVIFVHPGQTQAEMLREAEGFVIPPPSIR